MLDLITGHMVSKLSHVTGCRKNNELTENSTALQLTVGSISNRQQYLWAGEDRQVQLPLDICVQG